MLGLQEDQVHIYMYMSRDAASSAPFFIRVSQQVAHNNAVSLEFNSFVPECRRSEDLILKIRFTASISRQKNAERSLARQTERQRQRPSEVEGRGSRQRERERERERRREGAREGIVSRRFLSFLSLFDPSPLT